ncbi:MAG: PilW family protein [Pseudohongiellaceae bacterium]
MHGLSLVELMIAMVLGLTLSAGVIQIYVGTRVTEHNQEARIRMQENGRFGLNFLAQEIRMAGYLGCLGGIDPNSVNETLDGEPASFQPERGIQGWDADGTDPGDIANSANNVAVVDTGDGGWVTSGGNVLPDLDAVPDSDILRVWSASGATGTINTVTPGAETVINISPIDVDEGDVLLLSDCEQADWVQACEIDEVGGGVSLDVTLADDCNPGNIANAPITSDAGGEVMKLEGTILYVGKRNDAAINPPALFRARLGANAAPGNAEELIEGVESMQVLYGVNLDNDVRSTVDGYMPADQVPDWADVISVRISLLMQSIEDGVVPNPQAYTFNGVTYDGTGGNGALPDDNRVRRIFTSTINLRNRTLGI